MAITTEHHSDVEVQIAGPAEIDEAVDRELEALGLTFEELQEQAASDEFASERARRLWFFIGL